MNNWQLLLELTLKAMMILAAAGLVSVMLRNSAAALRHLIWSLALGGLLLLPVLTFVVPAWRVAILPASNRAESSLAMAPIAADEELTPMPAVASDAVAIAPEPKAEAVAAPALAWSFNLVQIALLIWAAGFLFVLARLAFGTLRMRRITRAAECLTDYHWSAMTSRLRGQLDLPAHISLYASDEVALPVTWGVLRPVIVLPADANDWSGEWRRIVLLHELAHIKRRDCLTQMLANVACALYWCNPLVWVAAWQMRKLREQACDDEVLAAGTRASAYASCLVDVAKAVDAAKYSSPVAVGMACSPLADRVKSILDPTTNRRTLSRRSMMLIATLAVSLMLPLAALNPYSQAATALQPPQQQAEVDKQRREIEQRLREIEKHRREITDVYQREIEKHLRQIEALQGKALTAEMKARLEAELNRVGADSKRAEQELQEELRRSSLKQRELAELEKLHALTDERAQREVQAEMEKALRALQDKNAFSAGEAELLQKRAQLEADLERLSREYTDKHPEMLERRDWLDAFNQQLLRLEQQGEAQRLTEGHARLVAQLAELEAQLTTLQRSYTNNHPKVQAAKEQLEALRRELELRLRK